MSDEYVLAVMAIIVIWLLWLMYWLYERNEKKYRIQQSKKYEYPESHKIRP